MTEQAWLACPHWWILLGALHEQFHFAQAKGASRKMRLFACAIARSVWDEFRPNEACHDALLAYEQLADGLVDAQWMWHHEQGLASLGRIDPTSARRPDPRGCFDAPLLRQAIQAENWGPKGHLLHQAAIEAHRVAYTVLRAPRTPPKLRKARFAELGRVDLARFRDIFGNPFRPILDTAGWLTGNVRSLAQSIYEERQLPKGTLATDAIAVLADALEDAGCDSPALLNHCRGGGEHVRGCWAIDLVLRQ